MITSCRSNHDLENFYFLSSNEIQSFWEAHKIGKNLPHGLDVY